MREITKAQAIRRLSLGMEVYRLYPDGSESLITTVNEVKETSTDCSFGKED